MINKNKFSIKNTKKVLHKVGKQWVVVSAVLLGLVAGGAAVTNANADTTQAAAQPTAAQQVAKNANMSSANHSFGAADPVNATKAPASSATMKLGAADGVNGVNGLVNSVKSGVKNKLAAHNLPSNKAEAKATAKQYASDADVNNLTKLAQAASAETSEASKYGVPGQNQNASYADLIDLASNASRLSDDITLGTTSDTSKNTLFGILSAARTDINGINKAHNTELNNISSKLADIQKFANTTTLSHTFTMPEMANIAGMSLPDTTIPGINKSVNVGNYLPANEQSELSKAGVDLNKLTVSANLPQSNVALPTYTLNVPVSSVINSGISNVSSSVNSTVTSLTGDIDSEVNSVATSYSGYLNANINGQLSSVFSYINTAVSGEITSISNDISAYKKASNFINDNSAKINEASNALNNNSIAKYLSPSKKAEYTSLVKEADATKTFLTENQSIVAVASQKLPVLESEYNTLKQQKEPAIKRAADGEITAQVNQKTDPILNGVQNIVSSVEGKINDTLMPYEDNGNIDPLAYDHTTLSALVNTLNSNKPTIEEALVQKGYGNKAIKINSYINDLNKLNKLVSKAVSNVPVPASYNTFINNLASLPNALSAPNAESKAASAYGNIATSAKLLIGVASNGIDTINSPRAHKIANDINKYGTTNIVNEANNLVTSMATETKLFDKAVDNVNGVINNTIDNHSNATNYKDALKQAKADSNNISAESYAYSNSLLDDYASVPAQVNNADKIKLTYPSNNKGKGGNGSNTGNGGNSSTDNNGDNYNPFVMPSTPTTNNTNYNVEPTNTNTVAPENEKHAANYAKVIKALQLHTNPNFTSKNAVAVVKPGSAFWIEKSVKDHTGALRYEVKYNKKNYYITANKRFVNAYYKAAKHANHSVNNYVHYRYAKVTKALQLHTNARFTGRNGVKVVRPGTEFHINNIVKNHGLVRYAVRYQGHNYFITANHAYTVNAYVQNYNYNKHGYKGVRVVKPINEYRKLNFAKRSLIRHVYRGSVLPVKKVITIAGGEMTRLQLTNGHYVTANKDFVEPIR